MKSGRYWRGTFRRFTARMFTPRKGVGENCSFPRGGEQRSVENREVLKNKSIGFYSRGASTIAITAALSVAILIAAIGSYIGEAARTHHAASEAIAREPAEMQKYVPVSDADGNGIPDWQDELMRGGVVAATSSATTTPGSLSNDPAASSGANLIQSLIGGYLSLKQSNQYTVANGEKLATNIAAGFQAPTIFIPHTLADVLVDNDTSERRVLQYRADMRVALAPMVDLNAEPEFSLFARFIQTGDRSWLDQLSAVTVRYRQAEKNMLAVQVPASAAEIHLRTGNALGEYTETLERLVRFSNDPLALMSLLRTYNDSEREFLLAFDALAKYYVQNVSGN